MLERPRGSHGPWRPSTASGGACSLSFLVTSLCNRCRCPAPHSKPSKWHAFPRSPWAVVGLEIATVRYFHPCVAPQPMLKSPSFTPCTTTAYLPVPHLATHVLVQIISASLCVEICDKPYKGPHFHPLRPVPCAAMRVPAPPTIFD